MYGNDVEILDSLFNDYNTSDIKHPPVAFLGKSLEVLARADVTFFFERLEISERLPYRI